MTLILGNTSTVAGRHGAYTHNFIRLYIEGIVPIHKQIEGIVPIQKKA